MPLPQRQVELLKIWNTGGRNRGRESADRNQKKHVSRKMWSQKEFVCHLFSDVSRTSLDGLGHNLGVFPGMLAWHPREICKGSDRDSQYTVAGRVYVGHKHKTRQQKNPVKFLILGMSTVHAFTCR